MKSNRMLSAVLFSSVCGLATAASAADAPPAQSGPVALQEVVVTAQRRSERLQDVPFSVTAINPKAMEAAGVRSTQDLPLVTPGLHLGGGGTTVQPAIRGVTTTSSVTENNVSIYIDGVYQAVGRGSIFDLPDVTSIEVLKGPQGTLFGRNATGGAILITTQRPDVNKVMGKAYVSYGNYGSLVTKGFVSAPVIADKLAVSVSGLYDHTDGWLHDLNNNGKRGGRINDYTLRGKVRFLPWDGADFTLTASYDRRKDFSTIERSFPNGNSIGIFAGPLATKPYTYATNVVAWMGRKDKEISLHGDIDLGPGKLSSTTAYHHNNGDGMNDIDNSNNARGGFTSAPLRNFYTEQEFLYTTNQIGRFHAVAGTFLYAYKQIGRFDFNDLGALQILPIDKTKSWAVFSEGTYDLTDQFSVTGGIRYTSENHRGWVGSNPTQVKTLIGDHTWHSVTPRVSLLYKVTPQTNLYGTFSKGFTSGTINTANRQTTPVNPEHVTAFEGGIKSNEISNVSFSAAAFHYNYTNLQVNSLTFDPVTHAPLLLLGSAAKSKIYGVEFNSSWRVSDNFDLTAGGTWVHARYANFPNAQLIVPLAVPTASAVNQTSVLDASGNHMIRSPDWSGFLLARYHLDTSRGAFEAAGNVSWSSKTYWDLANRLTQPSYTLVNANLSWTPAANPRLKMSIWGKNLGDKAVEWGVSTSAAGDPATYLPPRTFGVSLEYNY